MEDKQCKTCKVVKFRSNFTHVNTKGRAGWLRGVCNSCYNKGQRQRFSGSYKIRHREICKAYKDKVRKELHDAYGNSCACCGETTPEFLELDHINGGGNKHRKLIKNDLYNVVKLEGYPKDVYRLLCSNCNHSLGIKGYCPHQNGKTLAKH